MQQEAFWLQMTSSVYKSAKDFSECAHKQAKKTRMRRLDLFSASCPLYLVAVGILGPLPKTTNDNQLG